MSGLARPRRPFFASRLSRRWLAALSIFDRAGVGAKTAGVSLADLQAVNPGVDWTKLKVGQKLKLPAKK